MHSGQVAKTKELFHLLRFFKEERYYKVKLPLGNLPHFFYPAPF